mmetsp:Transcript_3890/g.5632  ORF Transcript_3890/g.5632 Transcript_3890/m.5632 type:complete len:215 (-) Transcript_3890:522-1166(-)
MLNTFSHDEPRHSPSSRARRRRVCVHRMWRCSNRRPQPSWVKFDRALTKAFLAISWPQSPATQIAVRNPERQTSVVATAFRFIANLSASVASACVDAPAVPLALSNAVEKAAKAAPHVTSNIGLTYSSRSPESFVRTNLVFCETALLRFFVFKRDSVVRSILSVSLKNFDAFLRFISSRWDPNNRPGDANAGMPLPVVSFPTFSLASSSSFSDI